MSLLNEIAKFILAALKHWQAYMTGGIIIAILSLYERAKKRSIPLRLMISIATVFLMAAVFMAWRDQYHATIRAEEQLKTLTTPQFEGSIDMVAASPTTIKDDAIILITAHIKNLGAPSIAEFSDCMVIASSGKESDGAFGPIPVQLGVTFQEPKLKDTKAAMIYPREDNLLIKGSDAPIPSGGAVSGWLYVIVHGISAYEVLHPGTVISLTVKDVRGQKLQLSYAMTATNIHKGLPQDIP
jgi:hypothetical protein